jgi:hypothetical protein
MPTELTTYAYEVDDNNRLTYVSPQWLSFAQRNQALQLTRAAVLGEPLLRFVAGRETVDLYGQLFAAIRRHGRGIRLPFRCDSARARQAMELDVQPVARGHLRLEGHLLHRERRPYVRLLDLNLARAGERVTSCSLCRRVHVPPQRWLEVEEAIDALSALPQIPLPQLNYVVCPDCIADVGRRMQAQGLV